MKRYINRFWACVMMLCLVFNSAAFAENSQKNEVAVLNPNGPVEMTINPKYVQALEDIEEGNSVDVLPEKYIRPSVDSDTSTWSGKSATVFPSSYVSDCSSIKTQIGGTCWAYATNALLENALLSKDETIEGTTETVVLFQNDSLISPINVNIRGDKDMSVEHMLWGTFQERGEIFGFGSVYGGAGIFYSLSYLLRDFYDGPTGPGVDYSKTMRINGPVTSEQWYNVIGAPTIADASKVPTANCYITKVKEVTNYSSKIDKVNEIKQMVMEDGAVSVNYGVNPELYNSVKHTQYINPATSSGGHAVIIVGWVDEMPLNYFIGAPEQGLSGAFIVKNSYGSGSGDSGFCYFSYNNVDCIGQLFSMSEISDRSFFENQYEYDEFISGNYKDFYLNNTNKIAYANIFSKENEESDEYLTAVSTFIVSPNTKFKAYYSSGDGLNNFQNLKLDAEGFNEYLINGEYQYTASNSGYFTLKVETPIKISSDEFTIAFEIESMNGESVYIPVEGRRVVSNVSFHAPTINSGVSNWNELHIDGWKQNVCIKAFTKSADRIWNFSNSEFENYRVTNASGVGELNRIITDYCVKGLTLKATYIDDMEIAPDIERLNGRYFSHRLELEGDGNLNERAVMFEVFGDTDIYITAKSSGYEVRPLVIADENGNVLYRIAADDILETYKYSYLGDRQNLYVYSEDSGIYIYELSIASASDSSAEINKEWNFASADFSGITNINSPIVRNGLSINPAAHISIGNVTVDGVTYSKYLQFNNNGGFGQNSLSFKVPGKCLIEIVARSSGADNRPLVITNKYGYIVDILPVNSTAEKKYACYLGSGDDLYMYSNNSGIRIYNIKVSTISMDKEPIIQRAPRSLNSNYLIDNEELQVKKKAVMTDFVISGSGLEVGDEVLSSSAIMPKVYAGEVSDGIEQLNINAASTFSALYLSQISDSYAEEYYDEFYSILNPSNEKDFRMYIDIPLNNTVNTASNKQLVRKRIKTALSAFLADYPEVFYVDTFYYGFEYDENLNYITGVRVWFAKNSEYPNQFDILRCKNQLNVKVNGIINSLNSQTFRFDSSYLKAEYIKNQLLLQSSYDEECLNYDKDSAAGALLTGKASSKGMAKAFRLLCKKAGIPCMYAEGYAGTEDHGWNYVLIDGNWYLCDITQDDKFMVKMPAGWLTKNISPYGDNSSNVQVFVSPSTDNINYHILGDADVDGVLTANDSAVTLQYTLNPQVVTFTTRNKINADADKDGYLTSGDSSIILQMVLGMQNVSVSDLIEGIEVTNAKSERADINNDGIIDLTDFAIMINQSSVLNTNSVTSQELESKLAPKSVK